MLLIAKVKLYSYFPTQKKKKLTLIFSHIHIIRAYTGNTVYPYIYFDSTLLQVLQKKLKLLRLELNQWLVSKKIKKKMIQYLNQNLYHAKRLPPIRNKPKNFTKTGVERKILVKIIQQIDKDTAIFTC